MKTRKKITKRGKQVRTGDTEMKTCRQMISSVSVVAFVLAIAGIVLTAGPTLAAPWTPSDITTELWLDAADADTIHDTAGAVSQWDDKSGNGNNVTQGTVSKQPIISGSTMTFTAAQAMATVGTDISDIVGPTLNKCAVFSVMKFTSGLIFLQLETSSVNRLGFEGSNRWDFPRDGVGTLSGWSTALSSIKMDILAATADGATQEVFLDGTSVASKANALTMTDAARNLGVGANAGGSYGADVDFQEIIFVDSVTVEVRQKLEGYLAWKWGLEDNLPTLHPYKSAAPTTSGVDSLPVGGNVVVRTVELEVTDSVGVKQWQASATGSSGSFTNLAGATSAILDVTALYPDTPWFQVEMTSGTNTAYSTTMKVATQADGTVLWIR